MRTVMGGSPVGICGPGGGQGLPSLERARSAQGAAGRRVGGRRSGEQLTQECAPRSVGVGAALTHFPGGEGASSSTGRALPLLPHSSPARKPLAPSSAPPPCGCKRQQTLHGSFAINHCGQLSPTSALSSATAGSLQDSQVPPRSQPLPHIWWGNGGTAQADVCSGRPRGVQ